MAATPVAMAFDTLDENDLGKIHGGIQMQLTQYGYRSDPYMDHYTRRGLGAYHHLSANESVALTDSALRALGLSRYQVRHGSHFVRLKLSGGGTLVRRIDDRAPERNRRVDLYEPGGFNRHLPGHADVSLVR